MKYEVRSESSALFVTLVINTMTGSKSCAFRTIFQFGAKSNKLVEKRVQIMNEEPNSLEPRAKRVCHSRPHYKSEKKEQKKRWRNRRAEKRRETKQQTARQAILDRARVKQLEKSNRKAKAEIERLEKEKRIMKERIERMSHLGSNTGRGLKILQLARPSLSNAVKEIDISEISLSTTCLGEGSYGKCYYALYRGHIPVAVKKSKNGGQAELLREANILQCLQSHKSLPVLFGVNTEERMIVMEFCGYKNSANELKVLTVEKALHKQLFHGSSDVWVKIIRDIVDGVNHVHSKGWLHTDLKPNNIVLSKGDKNWKAVIIDFGRACEVKSPFKRDSKPDVVLPWLSPEVQNATEPYSIKSDIYSVGYVIKCISGAVQRFPKLIKDMADNCLNVSVQARPGLSDVSRLLEQFSQ